MAHICEVSDHAKSLLPAVARLLDTAEFSDLIITCGSMKFNVHRNIIAAISKPLAAHLRHGMQEAVSGVIDLKEDDQEAVALMIEYIYKGSYLAPQEISHESHLGQQQVAGLLLTHTKVFVLADKFDILSLRTYAFKKYSALVPEHIDTTEFVESVKLIYTETSDRMLKDYVVAQATKHKSQLVANEDFVDVIGDFNELARDLYNYQQPDYSAPGKLAFCPECNDDEDTFPINRHVRLYAAGSGLYDHYAVVWITDYCDTCQVAFHRHKGKQGMIRGHYDDLDIV